MKKTALLFIGVGILFIYSCHKPDTPAATPVSESAVLSDFVNKTALPQYQFLQEKATALNSALNTLNTTPTAANLATAQQAWRDVRSSWEQCEGFLIGPVEDNNYDPNMDTWPVDYLQLDSFITSSPSFSVGTVQSLQQSLRGFHPIEFILWGQTGNATVDSISTKQKQYMLALSQDMLNSVDSLKDSWATTGGNFQVQLLNAGAGSTRFTTRQEAMLAIVSGMTDICDEVGNGKIKEPFDSRDAGKTESPFSHNSMTDFINNIKGAQNVYLCTYNGQHGVGMSNFVAAKNLSLDNKIKQQFTAAISGLQSVSVNFETAITSQRTQLQTAMTALNDLQATLDGDLKTFIQTYVKD